MSDFTPTPAHPHSLPPKSRRSLSLGFPRVTSAPTLSREEIINRMENEQDAIVVRLLREINALRAENARLRTHLTHTHTSHPSHKPHRHLTIDEDAITDDEETDPHVESLSIAPVTPRTSTSTSSRRTSASSSASASSASSYSGTIFPVETAAPFPRPQRFSFSYTLAPPLPAVLPAQQEHSVAQGKLAQQPQTPVSSRKRRTSASLEHNPHFKNHERKVSQILPQR